MLYLKQDDISLTVPSDLNLQISVPLMGVSCIIYPYICLNAVPPDVGPLLDWIKRYFDVDQQASAHEWWRGATPVGSNDRIASHPQYQATRRTIVGYEITGDGATKSGSRLTLRL